MKAALCFLISYNHSLNKEHIWIDWIEANKDIINVYVHYKDRSQIRSPWLRKYALPESCIVNTDYYHVVPAYLSVMKYGLFHDKENQWFCFLTEACVPIISPRKFRQMFLEHQTDSFMGWKPSWWNQSMIRRANLHRLTKEFHLANTPWFVLNKDHAQRCIRYAHVNKGIYDLICDGRVANESIFAIILRSQNCLDSVQNEETTATDWGRMMSPTSPYLFRFGDETDIRFIDTFLLENKYTMFLRKVDPAFPDALLMKYIYGNADKNKDKKAPYDKELLALVA